MKGKVCLVTGATSGIGYEAALGLAKRGATVVLAARDKTRGDDAVRRIAAAAGNPSIELLECDLADLSSVRAAAAEFKRRHDRLDVLLNNAGVWMNERRVTRDGFETTFHANHLGHFLLTNLLLDRIKASAPSRIVNVSSALHKRGRLDWDDLHMQNRYSGVQAYSNSKLANNLFTRELARRLDGTGVTVNAVHPGVIATNIFRAAPWLVRAALGLFLTPPEKGALPLLRLAADPDLAEVSGRYFDRGKEAPPAPAALDDADADRLWRVSSALAPLAP